MRNIYSLLFVRIALVALTILLIRCSPEESSVEPYRIIAPAWLGELPQPSDNQASSSKIVLGKALFFEAALSRDSTVSCASCHLPSAAFSDTTTLSLGVDGRRGRRNSPPLFNLAWHPSFFADGGVPSLEIQVLAPISNPNEMDLELSEAINRLKASETYSALFKLAFNREPDAFSLTRALAAYQRTLISANSRFDKFYFQGEAEALSSSEKRGWQLFSSPELNCIQCHTLPFFSSFEFENNGLTPSSLDKGRYRISGDTNEAFHFKVPSLRNISYTAPYMHDGSMKNLSDIIDKYAAGGSREPGQSALVDGFAISQADKESLIDFLRSLEDLNIETEL